jgi:superfamily II DNA or RNA helicase
MLKPGHYEQLINQSVADQISEVDKALFYIQTEPLDLAEAPEFLSRYLAEQFRKVIMDLPKDNKLENQVALINRLLSWLAQQPHNELGADNLSHAGEVLKAIIARQNIQHSLDKDDKINKYLDDLVPSSRFSQSDLFIGGNSEVQLDAELRKEIQTADQIYLLVSFIKWTGLRVLINELREFVKHGTLRIITTTYMGASDAKAIDVLAALPNTELKVSYNTEHERLHAKAYLFIRESGFNTGYIGSSNMSRSALTNGLEWNIKVTAQDNANIIDKFRGAFETYWYNDEFETYDPDNQRDKEKLKTALGRERQGPDSDYITLFSFKPYPYQVDILDRLKAEREVHNRWRNLVVAATGTGKTLISAFDYLQFRKSNTKHNLLFVAHREEILKQARDAFRQVLQDRNFGDLWVGDYEPTAYDHLFVSVQTYNSRKAYFEQMGPAKYDYIIVDEVHHGAAESYRSLLGWFQSRVLLGLTATPERADGTDILQDFCGTISAEIRLPEAINRGLLVPFHYFCITDSVDYRTIGWSNGRYSVQDLTNVYTANQTRVKDIILSLQQYVLDINNVTALGFCVSQEHAIIMANAFQANGLRADYLVSKGQNATDRSNKLAAIRDKSINYLFVVDILNEGYDLPSIDTILLLRPTESLTVYLQQLGRGLRLTEGKDCLTVLDFVGQARQEYNYEARFRALVGRTHTSIGQDIEAGFPQLPLGCHIQLEKEAQEYILANIKANLTNSTLAIVNKLKSFRSHASLSLTLTNFINWSGIKLGLIYKFGGWTALKVLAGLTPSVPDAVQSLITKLKFLVAINSVVYLDFIRQIICTDRPISACLEGATHQVMGVMLYYDMGLDSIGASSLAISLETLRIPALQDEVAELIAYQRGVIDHAAPTWQAPYPHPLELHCAYGRDQILSALGVNRFGYKAPVREGVYWHEALRTEILFVTFQKSEKRYSPTTMYHDYAISEDLFHWQSQNSASELTSKGKRYINHKAEKTTILLFARDHDKNQYGATEPYIFLGPVTYVSHTGGKPMNILWRLAVPCPAFLWQAAAKLAVG